MKPETITLGRLDGEVREMLARAGLDPRHATIVLHTPLEREHARNRRRYAQCIPDELRFEFATATLALAPAHREALIAHEVGHCVAFREQGDHTEDDADWWAEKRCGVPICYDKAWPGKGLQVDCRALVAVKNPSRPPSRRGWPARGTPPKSPDAYVRKSALDAAYRAQYVQGDTVVASSRTKKADYPMFPMGTWKIDDQFRGMYGHEIDELVLVADPRTLEPGEFDWSDPTKALRRAGKLEDMERYAAWMAEGHSYPPVEVVQTERGTLRITDGHRRAAAADYNGMPVKAWVSWLTDHPDPPPDRDMQVGLTYELATGQEWTMPQRTAPSDMTTDQIMRRLDVLDAIRDKTDEQYDEISELVDEVMTRATAHSQSNPTPEITHAVAGTVFDVVHECARAIADNLNADVVFENYFDPEKHDPKVVNVRFKFVPRVPKQRHLTLVENPKVRGFTANTVELLREEFEHCVGRPLESMRMWARYEAAKPSPRSVPIRMTIKQRSAQQADLFGNPERKVVATSKDRYKASAEEKRRYGGSTVTEFYMRFADDPIGKSEVVTGYGKTPGDRKTDAIRRFRAKHEGKSGNPFYMREGVLYHQRGLGERFYFWPIKKTKKGNWTGIMVRIEGRTAKATQTSIDPYAARLWQAIDPVLLPPLAVKAFAGRDVAIPGTLDEPESPPLPPPPTRGQTRLFNARRGNPIEVGDDVVIDTSRPPKWWRRGDATGFRVIQKRPRASKPYLLDNGEWVMLSNILESRSVARPRRESGGQRNPRTAAIGGRIARL